MKKRIFKDNWYAVKRSSTVKNLDGNFSTDPNIYIITGYKLLKEKISYSVIEKPLFGYGDTNLNFELEDGHLPGHRPIVKFLGMIEFLKTNPYQRAILL